MKKQLLTTIFLICSSFNLFAQSFQWAIGMGGPFDDEGRSIAVDAMGNSYITGVFAYIADFDPGPNTANLNYYGETDIYVAKYDAAGNYQWAFKIGSLDFDHATSIAADAAGNVYVTGYYSGAADFDPSGNSFILYPDADSSALYFAKYSTAGNLIWAKTIDDASGHGIALDGFGNVYLTGMFSTTDFNPDINIVSTLTGSGYFFAKYDNNGNYIWAKGINASGGDMSNFTVDNIGNVIMYAQFHSTVDFDPNGGVQNLTATNNDDIFIAKYDSGGSYVWAKNFGGHQTGTTDRKVRIDATGNVYIIGYFYGTANFDPLGSAAATFSTSSPTDNDVFFAKYDAGGNYLWANTIGSTGPDYGTSICVDAAGNAIIVGSFGGLADFNPGSGYDTLNIIGGSDVFLGKYDASGNYIWAEEFGGAGTDQVFGVSMQLDAAENILLVGVDYGGIDFDPGIDTGYTEFHGSADIYVAKYGTGTSGINGIKENEISLFPNPTHGMLEINFPNSQNRLCGLTITNLVGELVYQTEVTHAKIVIDVSKFSSGLYFVKMVDARPDEHPFGRGSQYYCKKFVVE